MTNNDELENTPEQLLARAYALRSNDPDETLKLYADWAETYDQTMLGGLSYSSPQRIAALAAVTEVRRDARILDVGCGKGFMLHDFKKALPNVSLAGIDISKYCLKNTMETVKDVCTFASCDSLPFADNSFDLVVAIATIHNLDKNGVKK